MFCLVPVMSLIMSTVMLYILPTHIKYIPSEPETIRIYNQYVYSDDTTWKVQWTATPILAVKTGAEPLF